MSLRLHGDTIARPGMVDFAVSVWPERPRGIDAVLARAIAEPDRYPDGSVAREMIASRHGRPVGEVLLLNGACEAFWLLAHALRPRTAACVHPAFTEPDAALRAVGTRITRVMREPVGWALDPDDVPPGAEMVVLGNPNNPTGALDERSVIDALARPGRLVVVDESFMDFACDRESLVAGSGEDGVIVVRSLTKSCAVAGLRVGYLLGPADVVTRLESQRQPWGTNAAACAVLAAWARDPGLLRELPARVARHRADLTTRLGALPGIHVWPSVTNFLMLRADDGAHLVTALAERGIAVRPLASFPGLDDRYIRIAVRGTADNARLAETLSEVRG